MSESKWTEAETAYLRVCLYKKWPRKRIAALYPHRSLAAIKSKLAWERSLMARDPGHVAEGKVNVPAHVLAERDRRANEYRTPAQILMGEPPPSQSALARQPGNSADRAEH